MLLKLACRKTQGGSSCAISLKTMTAQLSNRDRGSHLLQKVQLKLTLACRMTRGGFCCVMTLMSTSGSTHDPRIYSQQQQQQQPQNK